MDEFCKIKLEPDILYPIAEEKVAKILEALNLRRLRKTESSTFNMFVLLFYDVSFTGLRLTFGPTSRARNWLNLSFILEFGDFSGCCYGED